MFSQLQPAKFGFSAYLHFLSKEDSINAFEALKTPEFTGYCCREMQLVPGTPIVVENAEVDRRSLQSENPNQNLEQEILQFLCLRFVERSGAIPSQPAQQQYQQP